MLVVRVEREGNKLTAVFVDDTLVARLHQSVVGRKPAIPRNAPNIEEFREFINALLLRGAKNFAARTLARQAQTSGELLKKMQRVEVPTEIAAAVIEEMTRLGYLNDEERIGRFVDKQVEQGYGPAAIKQKLVAKGVDRADAQEQMASYGFEEQKNAAHALVLRRYTREWEDKSPKSRRKLAGALARRGFSAGVIHDILEMQS